MEYYVFYNIHLLFYHILANIVSFQRFPTRQKQIQKKCVSPSNSINLINSLCSLRIAKSKRNIPPLGEIKSLKVYSFRYFILCSFNKFSIINSPLDCFKQPQEKVIFCFKLLVETSVIFPQSHLHSQIIPLLFVRLPESFITVNFPNFWFTKLLEIFSLCKQPYDYVAPDVRFEPWILLIFPQSH